MLDHSTQPVCVGRAAPVPRLVHHAGRVLTSVDRLARPPAPSKVRLDRLQQRPELGLAVERVDEDMAPLAPLRVIAVVPHDEPADAVVPHVDTGHGTRVEPLFTCRLPP